MRPGSSGSSGSQGASGARNGLTLVIVILLAGMFSAAQQTPPRDNRATVPVPSGPTGTGALSGAVNGAEDGRPVRNAYVVLIGTTTGLVKVSSTDADGKFTFSNLPVDRFTVGVTKPPYLATVAGSKRPGRAGAPIAVAAGQKVAGVAIRMSMGAAISGTITDEKGQMGPGVNVSVMQWRMQGLERVLQNAGQPVTTDDQGHYRFFGLLPGEYVVTAMKNLPQVPRPLTTDEVDAALKGNVSSAASPQSGQVQRYTPSFFPGTVRATDAAPIVLVAGEERNNIDFRVEVVTTSRLDGVVMTADGQPAGGNVLIMAASSGSVLQTAMTARVGPDGRFSIANAQPGSYVLIVNGQGPTAGQFARATLDVQGGDVAGVQLTMRPAMTMAGRMAFDSATAPSPAGRRIPFRALTNAAASVGGPSMGNVNDKGAFTVTGLVPGRYLLGGPLAFGPTADTMTWTLQSVIVDGRDCTDLPIDISDVAPKDVLVTYTDKWQELSGRLQSQSGAPVSDFTILVFPEDKAYWFQGTRRIVAARPGTDGRFVLSGKGPTTLPPGKYLLAAVTDIGRDEQFDPAFLAQVAPAAIPITLGPGERKVQDLAIK